MCQSDLIKHILVADWALIELVKRRDICNEDAAMCNLIENLRKDGIASARKIYAVWFE